MNNNNKPARFTHFDELLAVRMSAAEFLLSDSTALPRISCETTQIFVDDLLELGFIFSHELTVGDAVGKDEGEFAKMLVYMNTDENSYALVTDLYHDDSWVLFTSYLIDGTRLITTSQPGAMAISATGTPQIHLHNSGSAPLHSQWKKHKRNVATEVPESTPVLFKPEQHLVAEESYYTQFVDQLLAQNILHQSDTQTVRFTRSGARTFHLALTSRSAKRPKPKVEEWIGKRGKLPLKAVYRPRNIAIAASAAAAIGIFFTLQQQSGTTQTPAPETLAQTATAPITTAPITLASQTYDAILPSPALPEEPKPPQLAAVTRPSLSSEAIPDLRPQPLTDQQKTLIADQEDEMWRIAVENAEFFLLSNDGDPSPWIRTARKIAAGFNSNDSRLARTYFLSALLEPDYRIAEQQYNRALSVQTKTLGLYHAETAQTLEALAWIAEHNKDDLEEAITHQRLAINIYHEIFGTDAEDTKAAEWKLEYFEDRLAGIRPKSNSNRRLLPALARFSR